METEQGREGMDFRKLISSSLLSIGVDMDSVRQIEDGAEIYGEAGILDSLHLVSLISTVGDVLCELFGEPVGLLQEPDWTLIDHFRNIDTLVSFLTQQRPSCRVEGDKSMESNQ